MIQIKQQQGDYMNGMQDVEPTPPPEVQAHPDCARLVELAQQARTNVPKNPVSQALMDLHDLVTTGLLRRVVG